METEKHDEHLKKKAKTHEENGHEENGGSIAASVKHAHEHEHGHEGNGESIATAVKHAHEHEHPQGEKAASMKHEHPPPKSSASPVIIVPPVVSHHSAHKPSHVMTTKGGLKVVDLGMTRNPTLFSSMLYSHCTDHFLLFFPIAIWTLINFLLTFPIRWNYCRCCWFWYTCLWCFLP